MSKPKLVTTMRLLKIKPKKKNETPYYLLAELEGTLIDEKTGEIEITDWYPASVSGDTISDLFEFINYMKLSLAQAPLLFDEKTEAFTGEVDPLEYKKELKKILDSMTKSEEPEEEESPSGERKVVFGYK